jgi:site-specific DNA-methyltransferase (adenine-specific)
MTTQPWTLHCGDGIAGLREHGIVDVVITDPPYTEHVHAKSRRTGGGFGVGYEAVQARDLNFFALTPGQLEAAAAAIAYNCRRWALVFCAQVQAPEWVNALAHHGMINPERELIWHKTDSAPQLSGDRPAFNYETIVLMHGADEKLRWNGGGHGSVFSGPIDHTHRSWKKNAGVERHTTAKPLWLMRRLVELFTEPGEMIADPFAGGATTLVAAVVEGRRAVGWEIARKNYNIGMRRLADPGTVPLEGPSIELPFAEPTSDETPLGSPTPGDDRPPDPAEDEDEEVAEEFAPWPDEKIGTECFGGSDFPEDEWDRF